MSRSISTRREFLRSAAALTAAGTAMPYWLTGEKARGDETKLKNDRPRVGAIGVGGRGLDITRSAARFGNIVAVCDVDLRQAEKAKAALGGKPEICQDYRQLLDRKDIDLIINGTPDHWHTAINVAACRSGRDVYTEKPLTLTIDEGKLLCKVVEDTGRIVQVGTIQRSRNSSKRPSNWSATGGSANSSKCGSRCRTIRPRVGPSPSSQFRCNSTGTYTKARRRCTTTANSGRVFNFRWWYEYAGGIVTDWGNHHIDIAHWGMDCDLSGPTSVEARALFPNPQGLEYYNTPDRFFSRLLYPNGVEVLFFSSMKARWSSLKPEDFVKTSPEQLDWLFGKDVPEEIKTYNRNGSLFIGEKGKVFVNRSGLHGKAVEELKENPLPADAWRAYPSTDHMANFFDCVKTRKQPCAPCRSNTARLRPAT